MLPPLRPWHPTLFRATPSRCACLLAICASVFDSACTRSVPSHDSGGVGLAGFAQTTRLPRIEEVRSPADDPKLLDKVGAIAVSEAGVTATFTEDLGHYAIALYGADGQRVALIDRPGDGPGEFRRLGRLGFNGATLFLASPGRPSVLAYDSLGRFSGEQRVGATNLLALALDSRWVDFATFGEGGFSGIVLERPGDSSVVAVMDVDDSPELEAATHPLSPSSTRWQPPYTRRDSVIFIGDPQTYTLYAFNLAGQPLATFGPRSGLRSRGPRELEDERAVIERALSEPNPANESLRERLDTLARERVAVFGRTDLGTDARRRLWVFSTSVDSTVVDIFADTAMIGRQTVDCFRTAGGAAVAGEYIALRCQPNDSTVSLRLFRIRDDD